MANKQSHVAQWKHNREFVSTIDPLYHDWIITAVFYTALHAIDTLLAHDKNSVTNHEGRNRALKFSNRYEFINLKYEPLYGLARTVRYFADAALWVPANQIQKQVIARYLYPIESSVQRLIGEDLKLGDVRIRI